ncbi:hypothetical protein [Isoptericola aurantiacus]|uniref:hypothetical protein n=1 Tax=Isoptericola aurantiacus TaxID=3377839 RepID=UPI00383ABCE9
MERVPGTVVAHVPAAGEQYVGSPTLLRIGERELLAVHDLFGPGTDFDTARVHRSEDDGATWHHVATLVGQFWSTLFAHGGAVYLLGTARKNGDVVIRRTDDDGRTWTTPRDERTGLLRRGRYHGAPTPVVEHAGRIWRAFEDYEGLPGEGQWGRSFRAGMLSAPVDADLLDASSWTDTGFVASDPEWLDGTVVGWLEGNAVVTREGEMVDLLRVDVPTPDPCYAALAHVSADGTAISFDPDAGFLPMPGAITKFTVRWDAPSERYWSLVNHVPDPATTSVGLRSRNTVQLVSSPDLRRWDLGPVLLHHDDDQVHAFQYVDWVVDGDDILFVSRTAFDDDDGGAKSFHDTNYLTFHRVPRFRENAR